MVVSHKKRPCRLVLSLVFCQSASVSVALIASCQRVRADSLHLFAKAPLVSAVLIRSHKVSAPFCVIACSFKALFRRFGAIALNSLLFSYRPPVAIHSVSVALLCGVSSLLSVQSPRIFLLYRPFSPKRSSCHLGATSFRRPHFSFQRSFMRSLPLFRSRPVNKMRVLLHYPPPSKNFSPATPVRFCSDDHAFSAGSRPVRPLSPCRVVPIR